VRLPSRFFFARFFLASPVAVCAGFSAVVLALCVLAGLHFKNGVEREFYRETENIAEILMASFDDDAGAADGILGRLTTEITSEDVSATHETDLHRLLVQYALQPSMLGPAILDRDGTLIASALVDPAPKVSLKDKNTFRIHAETPNETALYIGQPTQSLLTQDWVIPFSRALRNGSGQLYGVVLLAYRLQHFIGVYEKLKLSDRGLVGLVGKDGTVRLRTLNGVIGYGTAVPKNPIVYNRVMAGERHGTFFSDGGGPDDVGRIGSFAVSHTTPFYVSVGYDNRYLRARYIGFFYALGLCWLVLTMAMVAAAAVIHRLGELSQETKLEIVNSALAERQKLSADMHDSIGASLAALLAYLTTENVNLSDVKRRIGETLMELRFLVDSAETDNGDIELLLSNVRHRMGSSIELAGIALSWQVGALPRVPGLTARDALTVRLILMEALSNMLHHSKTKTAGLTAGFDRRTGAISIAVADDGRGFNPTDAATGRGLSNMRKRAASITTGAALFIDSALGRGTTVRIELRMPSAG
jgi:signal transduction histidine kinase